MRVRFANVTKSYANQRVLDGLTFETDGWLAILGPSGSGKTTVLRLAAGLIVPDGGEVAVDGRVSYVFQEDRLLPWMSALENVALFCELARAKALLDALDLAGEWHKKPPNLSGGQQRRVAIARALAAPFDILLMDEPFKGLDDTLRLRAAALMREIARDACVLLSTHAEADRALCDEEIVLGQSSQP